MKVVRSLVAGALLVLVAGATGAWRIGRAPADTFDAVRQRLTACALPGLGCAPPGVFLHQRAIDAPLDPAFGPPDPDTLVSSAWVRLGSGSATLAVPSMGSRAYAIQALDGRGRRLALATAQAPAERVTVTGDTEWVWVVARIAVADEADLPAVHALQDALGIMQAQR